MTEIILQLLERLVTTLEKQTELQQNQYADYASARKLSKENEARVKANDEETRKNNEAVLSEMQKAVGNQQELVKLQYELIQLQRESINLLGQINEKGKSK